jgi:DivIVA domain-containing protein
MADLVHMLKTVQFTEARRGLDRDEVRQFLESLATTVVEFERREADLRSRLAMAESRAHEAGEDASIRKTLVLAQRTADMAIAEAREEARKIIMLAEQQAEERMTEADQYAARTRHAAEESAISVHAAAQARANELIAEAKAEARRSSDDLRTRLRGEVEQLERNREILFREVSALEEHKDEQRKRVYEAVSALQMVLDHPESLRRLPVAPPTPLRMPESADVSGQLDEAIGAAIQAATRSTSDHVVIDLADTGNAAESRAYASPLEDPTLDTGELRFYDDGEAEGEMVAQSFFEQSSFTDDRWKPRRDRRR